MFTNLHLNFDIVATAKPQQWHQPASGDDLSAQVLVHGQPPKSRSRSKLRLFVCPTHVDMKLRGSRGGGASTALIFPPKEITMAMAAHRRISRGRKVCFPTFHLFNQETKRNEYAINEEHRRGQARLGCRKAFTHPPNKRTSKCKQRCTLTRKHPSLCHAPYQSRATIVVPEGPKTLRD